MKPLRRLAVGLLWALAAAPAGAGEHPACTRLDYDYHALDSAALRAAAATCRSPAMARLNLHRAYARDLTDLYAAYRGRLPAPHAARALEAFRIYLALAELLASQRPQPAPRLAAELNRGYEFARQVVELRLTGQDLRADWLEFQHRHGLPDPARGGLPLRTERPAR